MKVYSALLALLLLASCASETKETKELNNESPQLEQQDTIVEDVIEETFIPLDSFFTEVDTNFLTQDLIYPSNMDMTILFTEKKDQVVTHDGQVAPSKKHHDFLAYLPENGSSEQGWLYVGHETGAYKNEILGDGGGGTMFEVKLEDGSWNVVSDYHNVDFSTVRGTIRNCGGTVAPNGMIYSCEESEPRNNRGLYVNGKGFRDTSDVGGMKFNEHFGYIVEIDPTTRKATQKMIQMGRYMHEDLEFMDDRKTVYLSDDHEPAVFFKFVADKEDDYSKGQLYAYKQSSTGNSGEWLAMPMDTASLVKARDVAISLGASMYMRHEWFTRVGNKIYIAETGHDTTTWAHRLDQGGTLPYHMEKEHHHGNGILTDYWGRVLIFDTSTDEMSVLIEGGKSTDGKTVFSNPDCVTSVNLGGKDYLVLHEDINGNGYGRIPKHAYDRNHWYNEVYFLDLSIENPTVEDLVRFASSPMGAEFTGGVFTPDGKSFFLNVQHPFYKNKAPFNRSSTVVFTGF